ncbi:hypothetical protein FRC07_003400 [Ceratobasidium sp. 392]|nr:hypothetical protein FRC07_003400 [Ceratobasidium sp. 392]
MPCTKTPSESSTPDSLGRSGGSHDSDTTPSPSGYRSPSFDPQVLASKLALYEASKSLATVADTLATAAQVISKAAASLAVASGNLTTKNTYDKGRVPEATIEAIDLFPNSDSWSPAWQQNSYVLSANSEVAKHDQITSTVSAHVQGDPPSESDHQRVSDQGEDSSRAAVVIGSIARHPLTQTEYPTRAVPKHDGNISSLGEGMIATYENETTIGEGNDVIDVDVESQSQGVPHIPPIIISINPSDEDPEDIIDLVSPSSDQTTSLEAVGLDARSQSRFSVVLDCGFDELPAVALVCQQQPRTICFYKYWDAGDCFVNIFRALIYRPVVVSLSSKPEQWTEAAKRFLKLSEGVLLWRADVQLPNSMEFELHSDIRAIHIGDVSRLNSDINIPFATVIINQRAGTGTSPKKKAELFREYPVSVVNSSYNERGVDSFLHSLRVIAREHLSKPNIARAFYTAFIKYHRLRDPTWTPLELVERANEYSREYLLHGDSGPPEWMIGGRLPLKRKMVTRWKLEWAVQVGTLLVIP